jgi:hypothetical protein
MDIKFLERYMCSRFFIDFSDVANQKMKLEKYLALHFVGDEHLKYSYLQTLYNVVDDSTICLMGHERRQTLNLIHTLASHVYMEQEQRAYAKQLVIQHFDSTNSFTGSLDQQSNLIIDQVFYGTYSFPVPGGYTEPQQQHPHQYYNSYSIPTNYTCPCPCPLCPPHANNNNGGGGGGQMQCS